MAEKVKNERFVEGWGVGGGGLTAWLTRSNRRC
jgi:hypothetical protein